MTIPRISPAAKVLFAAAWATILAGPVWNYYIIEMRNADLVDRLMPFYPLFFLPLFIRRGSYSTRDSALMFASAVVCLVGVYTGVQTLIWLGGIWLGFAALVGFGFRLSPGGLLLFLLVPPVSAKTTLVFGFRLRLLLTDIAARVLAFLDPAVERMGNSLVFRGENFAVDPACEGLKMLTAAALVVLVLGRNTHTGSDGSQSGLVKRLLSGVGLVLATFVLWLLANLMRIIVLVFAGIGPESPRHGLVGILLFIAMVIFPLVAASRLPGLIKALTRPPPTSPPDSAPNQFKNVVSARSAIVMTVLMLLTATVVWTLPRHAPAKFQPWPARIAGFQDYRPGTQTKSKSNSTAAEIAVYSQRETRLILKQGLNPLRVGHHPRRCWQGLGYRFARENDLNIPSRGTVRVADITRLVNGKKHRYRLAWWYQSRSGATKIMASETKWRQHTVLHGETFTQVNILMPAGADPAVLIHGIAGAKLLDNRTDISAAGP